MSRQTNFCENKSHNWWKVMCLVYPRWGSHSYNQNNCQGDKWVFSFKTNNGGICLSFGCWSITWRCCKFKTSWNTWIVMAFNLPSLLLAWSIDSFYADHMQLKITGVAVFYICLCKHFQLQNFFFFLFFKYKYRKPQQVLCFHFTSSLFIFL